MNTVHLVGKIASEIVTQEFGTGEKRKVKASFLLAVRRPGKATEPDWVRIETWGKQAENLTRFNGKGSRVGITGRIRGQFYNPTGGDRGGQLRLAVVADEIMYLTAPKTGDQQSSPANAPAIPPAPPGAPSGPKESPK